MSELLPCARPWAPPDVVMVLENNLYPRDSRVRKEAESLAEDGRSVEVLAPREAGRPNSELIRGVRVRRFPARDGNGRLIGTAVEYVLAFMVIAFAVLRRLARSRHGTLHVHNPPDFFFPLLWLARVRGWSTVFDHHDDAAGMLQDKLGRDTVVGAALVWMRNRSAEAADLTIATNDTQRRLLKATARRVIVVRNSPPPWFRDYRPSPPSGRARLVFLGEIGAQDRVEGAIELLSVLVNDRLLDAELLIVGSGPRRGAVEQRSIELGVRDRVRITGWVPYEEVPVLLSSAHVGLDTAPLTEVNHGSTMIKILEYLAVGLPVVASGLHETKISGGDAIVAVDEDDIIAFAGPVCDLITNREAWTAAARHSRERGSELHWPVQAAALTEAYRELLPLSPPVASEGPQVPQPASTYGANSRF